MAGSPLFANFAENSKQVMKFTRKLICLSLPLLYTCPVMGQDLPDSFAMYGEGKEPTINYVKAVDSVLIDTARLTVIYSAYYRLYDSGFDRRHLTSLHVGDRYSLFNDMAQHIRSRHFFIESERNLRAEANNQEMKDYGVGSPSYFYKSVTYDYGSGNFKVVVPDIWAFNPATLYNLVHIYEEEAVGEADLARGPYIRYRHLEDSCPVVRHDRAVKE